MKTFAPKTLDHWREWLAQHHDSESEVWLIFHKLHTGVASIDYKDALDEALRSAKPRAAPAHDDRGLR